MARESRRHLAFLQDQLRATAHAIESGRSRIEESWELLAAMNRSRPTLLPG